MSTGSHRDRSSWEYVEELRKREQENCRLVNSWRRNLRASRAPADGGFHMHVADEAADRKLEPLKDNRKSEAGQQLPAQGASTQLYRATHPSLSRQRMFRKLPVRRE